MVSSQSLAKSIVKGSLRPKPDEVVLISTYPHTIELAEATALECQKAGADPALWLDTDALFYGNFKNYSVESLHRVSGHCVGLLDYVNSYIWLNGPRNPAPMATVPREKFAAMFEGEKAHFDKMFAKVPKNVSLAIGQVTRERAKTYGLNYPKWKAMVEAATVVNTERLGSLGNLVAGLVSRKTSRWGPSRAVPSTCRQERWASRRWRRVRAAPSSPTCRSRNAAGSSRAFRGRSGTGR